MRFVEERRIRRPVSRPFVLAVTAIMAVLLSAPHAGHADAPPARTPEGMWQGSLQGVLRLVVHVKRAADGSLTGTMDSPDQGATGLTIDGMTLVGDSLRFEMQRIGGRFAGAMNAEGSEIAGAWSQGGTTLPLTLRRTDKVPEFRRPQEPARPYPYVEDTVRVQNSAAGISLAGTLTSPSGSGPFPCVILITGSGPEDRDEFIFGHRPFLVIADYLTRHGTAVLRMDDRGVGGSSGRFSRATTEDFASDILAAVEFLKARKGIDPKRIGLIGHSEGGLIAPIVATKSKDVAFVVLLAGPGLPGDSVLIKQVELATRAAGAFEPTVTAERKLQTDMILALRQSSDTTAVRARFRQLIRARLAELPDEQRRAFGDPDALADSRFQVLSAPWMKYFLDYDPRPTLRRVRCPVLALNGEKDVQVSPKENLRAIEAALRAGGNRDFEAKELPNLNHLFQTATSGAVGEYAQIEETIASAALEEVSRWIAAHTNTKR